jgi:hypothetical protein
MVTHRAKLFLPLLLLGTIPLRADDGAASVAAGGIVVMKREPRIAMAKEVLQISTSRVIVDYDFRNDSDEDITTEVAFPIPDYDHDLNREGRNAAERGFDNFQLWVNGAAKRCEVDARAFLKDTDYTNLLRGMHVDVASFGHSPEAVDGPDLQRLTAEQHKQLVDLGLVHRDDGEPLWQVKKKYHWQQTFPARKTVHVRHEYSPIKGTENSITYGMGPEPDRRAAQELDSFCIDGRLHTILQAVANGQDKSASYVFVDFILTTANTWKTPIEDFTLVVERNREKDSAGDYVSFCWDGLVTKIDGEHFSVHITNFVPKKDLRIGFFDVRD